MDYCKIFKTLNHAGLVESTQDGRFIYYAANFDVMNGLVGFSTCALAHAESDTLVEKV